MMAGHWITVNGAHIFIDNDNATEGKPLVFGKNEKAEKTGRWVSINGGYEFLGRGEKLSVLLKEHTPKIIKRKVPVGNPDEMPGLDAAHSLKKTGLRNEHIYFRAQNKDIPFEKMITYKSKHVDEAGNPIRVNGLAALGNPGTNFGGAPLHDSMDIIIFSGIRQHDIYDGVVVKPIKEIARFKGSDYFKMYKNGSIFKYQE
jgi:hypothetical protein